MMTCHIQVGGPHAPPPAKITVPEGENKKMKRNFFIFDPKRGDEVGKGRDIRSFCDNPLMIRVTHLIVYHRPTPSNHKIKNTKKGETKKKKVSSPQHDMF
jgi:hypothetical protein